MTIEHQNQHPDFINFANWWEKVDSPYEAIVYTHLWINFESGFDPPKSPLKRGTFSTFGSVPSFLRRVREDRFDLCVHRSPMKWLIY
jgi:hypothetical protein